MRQDNRASLAYWPSYWPRNQETVNSRLPLGMKAPECFWANHSLSASLLHKVIVVGKIGRKSIKYVCWVELNTYIQTYRYIHTYIHTHAEIERDEIKTYKEAIKCSLKDKLLALLCDLRNRSLYFVLERLFPIKRNLWTYKAVPAIWPNTEGCWELWFGNIWKDIGSGPLF